MKRSFIFLLYTAVVRRKISLFSPENLSLFLFCSFLPVSYFYPLFLPPDLIRLAHLFHTFSPSVLLFPVPSKISNFPFRHFLISKYFSPMLNIEEEKRLAYPILDMNSLLLDHFAICLLAYICFFPLSHFQELPLFLS